MGSKRGTIDIAPGPPRGTAALVRLSPGLKEALLKAVKSGEKLSIRVAAQGADSNVMLIGGKEYSFRSTPESSCMLVEVPSNLGKDGTGRKVANVTEKLHVQRKLDAEEIDRVRKGKPLAQARPKAVKLETLPFKGGERTVIRRIIRRQDPGPDTQQTGSAKETTTLLPSGNGTCLPHVHKSSTKSTDDRIKRADPLKQAAKSKRSGPSNQLGIVTNRPPAEKVEVSNEAAVHAASIDDAKMCILALLYEKPYSTKVIQQAVVDCYQMTKNKRNRCPAKEYVVRTVQSVCEYCAHNKYALKPAFREEVEKFIQENKVSSSKRVARPKKRASTKVQNTPDLPVPPSGRFEAAKPPKPAQSNRVSGQSRVRAGTGPRISPEHAAPTQAKPAERKANSGRVKRPLPSTSATPPRDSPSGAFDASTSNKARKISTMGAAPTSMHLQDAATTHPVEIPATEAIDGPGVNLSTSRGNEGFMPLEKKHTPKFLEAGALEEEWFAEYERLQARETPEITSIEAFERIQEEYGNKYNVYMRLNGLINTNKSYFEGLTSRLMKGGTEAEQDALFKQLEADWEVTGTLSLRWSHAFNTLHEELKSSREKMEQYVTKVKAEDSDALT